MKEMLEIMLHNTTPARFAAYVRYQIRNHKFEGICADDINFKYWKAGNDLEFDYHDIDEKPCKAEKSISKPYEMQTYIKNWNGTCFNQIMEFQFDDEKTGSGYFYYYSDIH